MNNPSDIYTGFARAVRRSGEREALYFQGRSWTYAQLDESVRIAAAWIGEAALAPGSRVAFLARNSASYVIGWLATQALGLVHVPVNFMLGAREIAYILEHSGASLLYIDDAFQSVAEEAMRGLNGLVLRHIHELAHSAGVDEAARALSCAADAAAPPRQSSPMIAQLAYTSGTEAAPKGALMSDSALVHEYMSCIEAGDYAASDVVVHALPLFHCAQIHCFLTPQLFLGGHNVILDHADPAAIIAAIHRFGATSFFAPPTVWIGILGHESFRPELLRTLEKGYYGASIMPEEVLRGIRSALPWVRLWNYYGQTEIGPLAAVLRPEEHDARPRSAGRPVLFVESRVVDEAMRDVPRGCVGELVHRSPQLLDGYYRDEARTAAAFEGGWFHSGDLAVMDEQGYLEIVDRKKDMIKTGGENVASREVEEFLYAHPAIQEVAVIGLPDPKWVERVCAVVVVQKGMAVSEEDIITWSAKDLAAFKRPKQIFFVDALPKNPSGKILKKELRQQLAR
ncbi:fatty acyl-CoA synthetase [Novosphingobium sp. BL-52-GroH]|uniref:fatty acyl-CoA synthetase n=1 Tax=Novosphingobium sp. BL-52-GroH TaxID=3349877 RepID=UPI00384CA60C